MSNNINWVRSINRYINYDAISSIREVGSYGFDKKFEIRMINGDIFAVYGKEIKDIVKEEDE